jgi:phosphinothricin acetyltransferase
MSYQIEPMQQDDWRAVHAIFAEGIATGVASFAENAPKWEAWDADYLPIARFVARGADGVLGWAALSSVSSH